jgi:hypothetical protein
LTAFFGLDFRFGFDLAAAFFAFDMALGSAAICLFSFFPSPQSRQDSIRE